MIKSKKELKLYIMADRVMNGYPEKPTFLGRIKESLCIGGGNVLIIKYLLHLRKYAYFRNTHKSVLSFNTVLMFIERYKYESYALKLGFSIGYNSLGYGVVIPHYGTIVVNGASYIGPFSVLHTCTCVAGGGKTIGEGFYLSTGSQIVGEGYTIGNNVTVASHTLVNRPFTDNVLVAGVPAKCKRENYPKWWERDGEDYINRVEKVKMMFNGESK